LDKTDFITTYLDRIGYAGPVNCDLATLRAIQRAHLFSVPFENLDIMRDKPLCTDAEGLYRKIVLEHRGGICYELNGSLAELLRAIGFEVAIQSAGIASPMDAKNFDHMLLRVTIDGEGWLVDVGFGQGNFLEPIHLVLGQPQLDPRGVYRIEKEPPSGVMSQSADALPTDTYYQVYRAPVVGPETPDGTEKLNYTFGDRPRTILDFVERWTTFAGPDSYFHSGSVIALDTPNGRITLTDKYLQITEGLEQTRTNFEDPADFTRCLKEYYGIVLG